MADNQVTDIPAPRRRLRFVLPIALFLVTSMTTTLAGLSFVGPPGTLESFDALIASIPVALTYSIPLMIFLAAHEFGHYFAARHHGVDTTLPYFIPMPLLFGTMGAVIRVRSPIPSRKALFDIGVAGPLAGFAVALCCLLVGVLTMDGPERILAMHPEYLSADTFPTHGLYFGDFTLLIMIREIFSGGGAFFPPMNEVYHYPLLAVGWFGMFVTSLNLIPVGQLDGGHILYAMIGRRQTAVSRWVLRLMTFAGVGGLLALLHDATQGVDPNPTFDALRHALHGPLGWIAGNIPWWFSGWTGWLFWSLVIRFVVRVPHPAVDDERAINRGRIAVGVIALVIFALTVSWTGLFEIEASGHYRISSLN